MSTLSPDLGSDGQSRAAFDQGFHKTTVFLHCLFGWIAYMMGNSHVRHSLAGELVSAFLSALIISRAHSRFSMKVTSAVFAPLTASFHLLTPAARIPYLLGLLLFVVKMSTPLQEWMACDGPPEAQTGVLMLGIWCVGCYTVTVIFCFAIWSVPMIVWSLLPGLWRPYFIIPAVLLFATIRYVPGSPRIIRALLFFFLHSLGRGINGTSDQLFGSSWGHWWHFAEVRSLGSHDQEQQHRRYAEEWPVATDESKPQIRLLRLHRRLPFARVRASMETCDLASPPPYETLSYCWGGDTLTRRVLIDGKHLFITESAYEILHARSSYFRERVMWIDGLCIDQTKDGAGKDQPEKAGQIKLMGEIYRRSTRTIVWLGYHPTSGLVVDLLTELALAYVRYSLDDMQMHARFSRLRGSLQMQALLDLLSHPWFSRVWIIQEVVVPRTVHVLYGGQYLEWDLISIAIEACGSPRMLVLLTEKWHQDTVWTAALVRPGEDPTRAYILGRMLNRQAPPRGMERGMQINDFRGRYQQDSELRMGFAGLPLHQLLFCNHGAEAGQGKDKVFGLLGMVSPLSVPGGLMDQYRAPYCDIFIFTAKAILADQYLLWTLPSAGTGPFDPGSKKTRLPGLPSWVPDWSQALLTNPHTEPDLRVVSQPYAAGTVPRPPIPSVLDNKLHLKGIRVTTIAQLATHCFRIGPSDTLEGALLAAMADQLDEIRTLATGAPSPAHQHPNTDAVWRTLVGDRSSSGTSPAPAHWAGYYASILRAVDARASFPGGDAGIAADPVGFLEHLERAGAVPDGGAVEFTTRMGFVARGRRFAVMADGAVGWVPAGCREGDGVVVLLGGQVPFVVRGTGEKGEYELLGEGYVHGIMEGEVLRTGWAVDDITLV